MPDLWTLAALVVALLGGALATLLMRVFSRRVGFVNHPNPIVPQHTTAVAYGGGVGVWTGFALACALTGAWSALVVGSSAAALGLLDDARPLSPAVKFGLQVVPAGLFALLLAPPLTGLWFFDLPLATFVALTLMNAVNFTDVCDGLVGGLGAIALASLGVLTQQWALVAMGAACLGFLLWNRPPASIYLGDAGSHLVGLGIAWGVLSLVAAPGPMLAQGVAATLISGVFLFELVFITTMRASKGLPWWRGSPDHFSLRMQAGPFSKLMTVLVAYGTSGSLVVLAVVSLYAGLSGTLLAVTLGSGLAAAAWLLLLRWEVVPRPEVSGAEPAH